MPSSTTGKELAIKAADAWALKVGGSTWRQIATKVGYTSATAAAADVRRWRKEAIHLETETSKIERLHEEIERLDTLQQSVWQDALSGDNRAVESALKIIALRARLVGLEDTVADVQQTVVVTGDQYLTTLRSVVDEG
jgi:uncharacterized protein (UPF0335 family)